MLIINYIIVALIWLLTLLPLSILYLISDLLFFFLYYVFGYRKKVVLTNLKKSFPHKSDDEINKIARKFYKNLSDIIIEVLKLRHMSSAQLSKRIILKNIEVIDKLYKSEKKIIAAVAHTGNWEWIAALSPLLTDFKVYMVYKPLSDKFFNDYLLNLRSKFGLAFIPFKQSYRFLLKNRNVLDMTILASDQTPTSTEIEYWANFLNQETGFFIGIEKIARSIDYAVVYVDVKRIKRGYYEIEFIVITYEPKMTKDFEITEKYIRNVENTILNNPDNWLWSHKRWKHKKTMNNEQ